MNIDQQKITPFTSTAPVASRRYFAPLFARPCANGGESMHHALRWYLVMPTQQVGNPVFTQYLRFHLCFCCRKKYHCCGFTASPPFLVNFATTFPPRGALEFWQVEVKGDRRSHEHVMSQDPWHGTDALKRFVKKRVAGA